MNILIQTKDMNDKNAFRGIGMYTMQLTKALKHLGVNVTNHSPDLIHYPYFDLYFHTLPISRKLPTVVTIHDVIPLVFKYAYPPGIKGSLRYFQQLAAIQSVPAVITDSECSKKDICKYLKIPEHKVFVTYLAANPDTVKQPKTVIETIKHKYKLPDQYVLYVGDMNYNKNLPQLIKACSKLPTYVHLVLVGRSLNNTHISEGKLLHKTIEEQNMKERTHILDAVPSSPDPDMSAIISGAQMYIQPSLYEGFGLPVLDAMQCEVPVVSSNTSSLPEVYGNAAVTFNPYKIDEMVDAMHTVLAYTKEQRKEAIKKGIDQAKKFSWENTAKQTIDVYKKVLCI